ncbi:TPA: H-NS family nucleoid-associated regulatory protein [Burkholderia cenocepacia]|jgi:DNA-binding protein H-NS|uniref:H-NS histone family protein n=1 Tax=Burkholderia cepacia complex TaxID=87882 RepID=UPI00210CB095|nr:MULTISPECIES: H-NS histone family protein [Burkholderia cepacia complex]MCQ4564137.1 H-NS histone family protein [Burkholderia contaminans]MCW3504586.1 H-NS histone family protein [Burkholderia cenocepacia]MCW3512048.1 H-NS histone family protein [Burkholderia cenocepacia]MCW3519696.1 H-NS histone family protein [Burkholderia cenocepacia]MCW3535054.1 H-NS histone family protein [Burkholderia cenocepacia]
MSNLQELQTQLRDLNVQLAEAKSAAKRALLGAIKDQAQELGITQDELLIAAGFKKPRRARAPAKYYDPSSGRSWSGHGPRPKWLDGKNLEDYLVDRAAKAWWPGE